MPKVTVITPTYGRSDYLPRAIDSILKQTHQDLELVIVNDNIPGSTEDDLTTAVLESYNDKRIKHIHTTGRTGGGAARNKGLKESTGDYIAFLDDDDVFLPDKVEKQLKFMIDHDLDMSYQDVTWYDSRDNIKEYRRHDRVKNFSKEGLMRVHLQVSIAPTAIYMVKRSALTDETVFGEVPRGQDFYFMVNCINAGLKIGYMPGAYVKQYLHEGERISVGPKFIKNVTNEWKDKKRLAEGLLSKKELRYMDFRFNCICGFATLRGGSKIKALPYFAKAFFYSPADSFKEAEKYFRRK